MQPLEGTYSGNRVKRHDIIGNDVYVFCAFGAKNRLFDVGEKVRG